jgi:hypothetical protein
VPRMFLHFGQRYARQFTERPFRAVPFISWSMKCKMDWPQCGHFDISVPTS